MPIVPTLQGTVTIEAVSALNGEPLYTKQSNAQADSIGYLLDKLVAEADQWATWVSNSEPEPEGMNHWHVTLSHPSVYDIATGAEEPVETLSKGTAVTIGGITEQASLLRARRITEAVRELNAAGLLTPEAWTKKPRLFVEPAAITDGDGLYGIGGSHLDRLLSDAADAGLLPMTPFVRKF